MAYGYVIAAVLGITLGVMMARVRVIYAVFEPIVEMIRPVPTIIFIPVIILYVGLGREMNVLSIVITATEPILIASFSGARAVSPALRDTTATFGLSWWQALREIIVPAAAPQIFVGLRLALASSLVLAIASGMIAGNSGIGFYILTAQQTLDIARMYAGAATVAAVGYTLNFCFLTIERRLLHWHAAHDRPSTTT
jgi:ABC-type nitrate/sulfonate/bicarbonate transport system permease component